MVKWYQSDIYCRKLDPNIEQGRDDGKKGN